MRFNFLRPKTRTAPKAAASTGGRVVYAVGDIHGRLDLLDALLETITADAASLGGQERPVLVFVGDYIDRGPASKAVIDRLIGLRAESERGVGFELRALMG